MLASEGLRSEAQGPRTLRLVGAYFSRHLELSGAMYAYQLLLPFGVEPEPEYGASDHYESVGGRRQCRARFLGTM